MPKTAQPQGVQSSTSHGHGERDARANGVFGAVGLLALVALAIHFILSGWLGHLNKGTISISAARTPTQAGTLIPSNYPRLQISPQIDLGQFKRREQEELTSYGWVNRTAGIVRIPIQKAMDVLLEKGLPTNQSPDGVGPSPLQLQQLKAERPEPTR